MKRRILVVDDDPAILDLTRAVLVGSTYDVTTAGSGFEALRLARREEYDLVLLDINMPQMDGWETLRLLKADEDLASLRVVMFSIKGEIRDKTYGLQEGATDYITKPFAVDELLARVSRILDSPQDGTSRSPAAWGGR